MINSLSESITLSINLKGNLLSLKTPLVMGILNITNDSFYKKSRFIGNDNIIEVAQQMFDAGATIIDIGAASSRPGAKLIDAENEIETLLPVLENLVKHFPEAFFSIDTYHSKTAKYAVDAGAAMINDISSGSIDKEMFSVIAALNVPYVMMHMQGIPETMQDAPRYSNVVKETLDYFIEKVSLARQLGIKDVIIDPGFGFGKALNHNYLLLQQLHLFNIFQVPILCGLSRKSFINKIIETNPDSALNGTTVLNTIALLNGANILRVHDVLEAQQAVRLVQYYLTTKGE
jgi:dihydropteroate synthase